jgi:protoporphyrin/coproporphyrin ferrochelatase
MARRAGGDARRVAVVLFNLGGPTKLSAVGPFLFRLFVDPAILAIPGFLRWPLAALITALRTRGARANYARIGGGSPLLSQTQAQAEGLERALSNRLGARSAKVFVAMRYAPPLTAETAKAVAAFAPDEVVLLPLYPQYSTTTTASSLTAWRKSYRGGGRSREICCYPTETGLIWAHAERIETAWTRAGRPRPVRLLFSAHGLPARAVEAGDPYRSQVEATAAAVAARLDLTNDWKVCYQSRVGPLAWLKPYTADAIREAGGEGLTVVVAPIAFVSEHLETLVELDHDYAKLATASGCSGYIRAPALSLHAAFIEGLAETVVRALGRGEGLAPGSNFACAAEWSKCPYRSGETAR